MKCSNFDVGLPILRLVVRQGSREHVERLTTNGAYPPRTCRREHIRPCEPMKGAVPCHLETVAKPQKTRIISSFALSLSKDEED